MGQVLIVSNRLPVSVKKVDGKLEFSESFGGLATGLSSYVKDRKSTWVGWPGIASEELTEDDKHAIARELKKHRCSPVFLNKRQIDEYYNGYSNRVLWPLFHNLPFKESADDQERWWQTYRNVNKLFAETVLSMAGPNTTIWVHDYQLMMLPGFLEAQHSGHIGFFSHIPFPSNRTYSRVTHPRQLLLGTLGANLVGFHTTQYAQNFLQACQKYGIGVVGADQLILPTRTIQVMKFPIGVDYEKFAKSHKLRGVKRAVKRYRKLYGRRRKIIVAVDRLEPAKGLVERLKAYRDFLAANSKMLGKVVFVMVAAPSRTEVKAYQDLAKRLQQLTNAINQEFGTERWQPVDLINGLPFEEVSALYQLADVAYIAPLRDGMNLVAKEYIATKHNSGVLILSQTAGAAEELHDALLIDPKKPAMAIAALQEALNMPRRELRRRLKGMQRQLSSNTIHHWAGGFMKTLQQPVPGTKPRVQLLKNKPLAALLADYQHSRKRLLLLDYDGSLVPFSEDYRKAAPPKSLLDLLGQLAANDANKVVLISGRQADDLEGWFGHLPVHLVAEHGAVIKKAGAKTWQTIERVETTWKKNILLILNKYTALAPGAIVEVKPHSLRLALPQRATLLRPKVRRYHQASPQALLKKYGVQIYQGNKILEIKDPRVNKGTAVERWLKHSHDYIMAMGDDYTDEDLFVKLAASAATIKVGPGRTAAKYRVKDSSAAISLLKQFTKL